MPKADVQVSVDVPGFDGSAGFVTTGDRAWFTRGNVAYAVPAGRLVEDRQGSRAGHPADNKAPKLNVNPSSWLQNVKSEGTEQMDGVQ